MKIVSFLLILTFAFSSPCFSQDKSMFKQKKERKKVWRKWNRKRDAYNPYLKKKNKNKPSVQAGKSDKKEIRRQKRAFKKQLKRAKRKAS